MQHERLQQLIEDYLDRVNAGLADLPESERSEIVSDLRGHVEESIGDLSAASEVDVRNVLERLGDAEDVAREARSRPSEPRPSPAPPPTYDRSGMPGGLEVAAIILTALFWPVGLLLAWISERWKTLDKVIATVVPVVSTVLFVAVSLGGLVVYGTDGGTQSVVSDQVEQAVPVQPSDGEPDNAPAPEPRSVREASESPDSGSALGRFLVIIGFLVGILGGPFFSAIYLAIRMQRSRGAAPTLASDEYHHVPARGQV